MAFDRGLLERIRSRGEEVLAQISAELMSNPRFLKAMEGAMRGREKLEAAASHALRQMNVPTRSDLRRANSRIDALEREVSELRAKSRAKPSGSRGGGRRNAAAARRGKAGARGGRRSGQPGGA